MKRQSRVQELFSDRSELERTRREQAREIITSLARGR
jgi:hypothetical protein